MKRYLSLLLTVIMLVSGFALPTFAAEKEVAEVGTPSQAEAVAWLSDQVGKSLDYDGAYGAQCVDLVKYYYNLFGYANYARGNGCDYATNTLPPGWSRIKGGTPQTGDVLVWTGGPGGYGHVAVYGGGNNYYHQNWSGQYVQIITKSYTSGITYKAGGFAPYWGVIRPQFGNHTTHSYDTYVYYWAAHPHYKCYKCSCGEIKENRDEPTYIDSCAQCRVGKTTVSSDKDVYYTGENVKLSWTAASNATHYNFYIMKKNSSGEYKEQIDWIREYKQTSYTIEGLSAGDYMIHMYSYDSKHWEPDGSDWCHEMADQIYFSVKENEQNIETIELSLEGGDNFIPVSWAEVPGAVKYEFSAVDNRGNIKSIETAETTIEWDPDESGFFYESIRVQVKAFDSKGTLVGKSDEQWYEIGMAHGDWWGECGDADLNGNISVKDATFIQKYVANIVEFSRTNEIAADADGNNKINVKDATAIQKYLAGMQIESCIGEKREYGTAHYSVSKPKSYESDWVLASELPDGAEVSAEKWTYKLTETTTSKNSSLSGWTQTGSSWEEVSSKTHCYADYPGYDSTDDALTNKYGFASKALSGYENETTKRVVSSPAFDMYIYWHWCRGQHLGSSVSSYNRAIEMYKTDTYNTFHALVSKTDVGYNSSAQAYWFVSQSNCDDSCWWNRSNTYKQTYTDYEKVYSFEKVSELESEEKPGGADISDVQKWVKYTIYS